MEAKYYVTPGSYLDPEVPHGSAKGLQLDFQTHLQVWTEETVTPTVFGDGLPHLMIERLAVQASVVGLRSYVSNQMLQSLIELHCWPNVRDWLCLHDCSETIDLALRHSHW